MIKYSGEYLLIKDGTGSQETITNIAGLAELSSKKSSVEINFQTTDSNKDSVPDVLSIEFTIYGSPTAYKQTTLILPLKVYISGPLEMLINDFMIVSIDGAFESANVVGDLLFKQKRIIN